MKMTRTVKKEKGAALLISLIVLLALTLMAVSGMQSSIFQERMSSSQREGMDALQLAERVLSDVEDILRFGSDEFSWTDPGFYELDDPLNDSIFTLTASRDGCQLSNTGVGAWGRNNDVRGCAWYTVEALGQVPLGSPETGGESEGMANRARITVLAVGPSGESRRAIEALYFYP